MNNMLNIDHVYTSRLKNPRYAIFHSVENKYDGLSHSRLIGIFDDINNARLSIGRLIEEFESECIIQDGSADIVKAKEEDSWQISMAFSDYYTEHHHFTIESFSEGLLYTCNMNL